MRPAIVALTLPLTACGGTPDGRRADVVDSAGVSVVWNRGPDVPLDWGFEPAVTIGGEADGPQAFFQVGANSVDVDAVGNVYVLDRGNYRILVFDREGRHLRTMGRQGGGPGELEWPHTLIVLPNGAVSAADLGKRGLVRYAPDGAVLGHRLLEGWSGGPLHPTAAGVAAEVTRLDGETRYDEVVLLGEDTTEVMVSVRSPPTRPADFGCVKMSGMAVLFAPSMVWTARGGTTVVAPEAAYVVNLYDRGRLVTSVRRDVPLTPVTRELAIEEAGDGLTVRFGGPGGGGACKASPEDVVEQQGHADVIPAVARIALAPDGTLWVGRRTVRGEPRPIDLFTGSGRYMGTLPPGSPFPAAFMPDGGIVGVEFDELDVPRIVVYRPAGGEIATP